MSNLSDDEKRKLRGHRQSEIDQRVFVDIAHQEFEGAQASAKSHLDELENVQLLRSIAASLLVLVDAARGAG